MTETTTNLDALLRQHEWLKRLARALADDAATADDAVQDTYLAALHRPPARLDGAGRGWLTTVLRNVLRMRRRRSRYETTHAAASAEATVETAPAANTSPEALAARVQLHRIVAGHVLDLPAAQKDAILLCYFEGLTSSEAARRLGVSAGTVRWRVKEGLDEIRRRLDDRYAGKRKAWLVALGVGPVRRRRLLRRTATIAAALGGAVAIVLLAVPLWTKHRARSLYENGYLAQAATRLLPSTPARVPRFATNAAVASCPEVGALRTERDALAAVWVHHASPQKLFARETAPNAEAARRFGEAIDRALRPIGLCGHAITCRGMSCLTTLLVPAVPAAKDWTNLCADRDGWRNALGHVRSMADRPGRPVFDAVAKTPLLSLDVYWALVRPDGAAQPHAERAPPPEPPAGWNQPRNAVTPSSAACAGEARALEDEIRVLVRDLEVELDPARQLATSPPNPALAERVTALARPVLSPDGRALPFVPRCGGNVCRLDPRDDSDPESAIRRRCFRSPDAKTVCTFDMPRDWWFARLEAAHRDTLRHRFGFVDAGSGADVRRDQMPYVLVRPEGEQQGPTGADVLIRFGQEMRFSDAVATCEREHPASGELGLRFRIADAVEVPPGLERRVRLEAAGGPLAWSPLARCLVDRVEAAAAQFPVPVGTHAAVVNKKLTFPSPAWPHLAPRPDR